MMNNIILGNSLNLLFLQLGFSYSFRFFIYNISNEQRLNNLNSVFIQCANIG